MINPDLIHKRAQAATRLWDATRMAELQAQRKEVPQSDADAPVSDDQETTSEQ